MVQQITYRRISKHEINPSSMSSQSKQAFKVHVNSCLENVMKKNSWYIAHSDETLMEDGFQPIMDPVNWNFFLFNFGNFF